MANVERSTPPLSQRPEDALAEMGCINFSPGSGYDTLWRIVKAQPGSKTLASARYVDDVAFSDFDAHGHCDLLKKNGRRALLLLVGQLGACKDGTRLGAAGTHEAKDYRSVSCLVYGVLKLFSILPGNKRRNACVLEVDFLSSGTIRRSSVRTFLQAPTS